MPSRCPSRVLYSLDVFNLTGWEKNRERGLAGQVVRPLFSYPVVKRWRGVQPSTNFIHT
jgi:hypothetical protein